MTYQPAIIHPLSPVFINPWSYNSVGPRIANTTAPTSGGFASQIASYVPFFVPEPYDLQRFFWLNGATVGTDNIQMAIYTSGAAGPTDCVVASGLTLSAGSVNNVQYAGCSVAAHKIIGSSSTTDGTSFTTASVNFKARPGYMYLLAVVNTHGSSANTVTAATTGGALTFTSRATTQFNTNLSRITLFSLVPSSDVSDTIVITIGSAQTATGCLWSLVAFTNVDTATTDGVVQSPTATGSSTTPSVTLSAFGSANNATYGAHGTAQTAATPGTGFTEQHDVTISTPTAGLETEFRSDNDTSVDATITSAAWGSIGAEIKSLGTTAALPPGEYWTGLWSSGGTATGFRLSSQTAVVHLIHTESSLTTGLPLTATPVAPTTLTLWVAGITNRSTP